MRKLVIFVLVSIALQACGPNMEKYRDNLEEGIVHLHYSRFETAIQYFNRALKHNPKSHEAYFQRGNANRNLHDYNAAMNDYNKAIELNPSYADAYYNRGLLKEFLENNVQAGCADFIMAEQLGKQNVDDRTRWCR